MDPQHRFTRQQAPEEQIAIARESLGERRTLLHEVGRIEKVRHAAHARSSTVHAVR